MNIVQNRNEHFDNSNLTLQYKQTAKTMSWKCGETVNYPQSNGDQTNIL